MRLLRRLPGSRCTVRGPAAPPQSPQTHRGHLPTGDTSGHRNAQACAAGLAHQDTPSPPEGRLGVLRRRPAPKFHQLHRKAPPSASCGHSHRQHFSSLRHPKNCCQAATDSKVEVSPEPPARDRGGARGSPAVWAGGPSSTHTPMGTQRQVQGAVRRCAVGTEPDRHGHSELSVPARLVA